MKDILHKSLSAKTIFLVALGFSLIIFLTTGTIGAPVIFVALAIIAFIRERKNKKALQNGLEIESEKHVKHGGLIALGLFILVVVGLFLYIYLTV